MFYYICQAPFLHLEGGLGGLSMGPYNNGAQTAPGPLYAAGDHFQPCR